MALDQHQLITIRSWVGTVVTETDVFLSDAYDRIGTFDGVISELLRMRISQGAANPTNISLPGGLTLGFAGNNQTWQSILKYFLASGGSGLDEGLTEMPLMEIGRITRSDLR